ncbi:MAG: cupin domain-containing protein [Desulfurococcales archaeon]|nr:cupin domain-containing protein [Desulfurococcales archaeon]
MDYSKPIVMHEKEIPAEKVSEEMAIGTRIQWLVGMEAPTFAMRRFTLEPRAHIKNHRHPWEHEIYVLEGSGRVAIDGKVYEVGKDTFLYIPPCSWHEYWAGDDGMVVLCMIPVKPTSNECVREFK